MEVGNKALTDTQQQVLDAGKALAEQLGLTLLPHQWPDEDIELTEGQTALIVSPYGMNIGLITMNTGQVNRTRYSNFFLNGTLILQRSQRFNNDEWIPACGPEIIHSLPMQSVLYVS